MILPHLTVPDRINSKLTYCGTDSLEYCFNKKHFKSYPFSVDYVYNSRGFRDNEWPDTTTQLKNAIWCVGDSATVGIGNPLEHTWPHMLQQRINCRTINISAEGVSNNWIARNTVQIIKTINPGTIIIHWSFIHRDELNISDILLKKWLKFYGEVKNADWPHCTTFDHLHALPKNILREMEILHGWSTVVDWEQEFSIRKRTYRNLHSTVETDIDNTIECIRFVSSVNRGTNIIHSFIPEFAPNENKIAFFESLDKLRVNYIEEIDTMDLARDYNHYGVITANQIVEKLLPTLLK